ncbi:MAG: hypothetical protein KatS3mg102_2571 [Planctomycetota bacterium]|nr:MAG: hypothetical protein KatS3mg102_2571 [Planctomycetota bacterium]
MSLPLWIASLLYLSAVTSWVCVAVREPDDRQALRRAASFFVLLVGGIAGFGALVFLFEALV